MRPANYPRIVPGLLILLYASLLSSTARAQSSPATEWPSYGNDPSGMRYSPLIERRARRIHTSLMLFAFVVAFVGPAF